MTLEYKDLLAKNEKIERVLHQNYWQAMERVNETTISTLKDMHVSNIRENIRNGLWDKHGPMSLGIHGLGRNKAVIAVGAGSSYNRNSDTLKRVSLFNILKPLDDQPFIIVASNHMYRPLLADGIQPHFVALVDGSDVVMGHLCENIPPNDKTILLTGLQANPKVLKEWDRQGRAILFYVGPSELVRTIFFDETREYPDKYVGEEGGNVLNNIWIWGMKFMKSSVHICVGNDLSYPMTDDEARRRRDYYADGEYEVNIRNRRDEARYNLGWMGFEYDWNPILDKWVINFVPRGTSYQLWTYKKWIETQVAQLENDSKSWHYFNCSESGILGMIANDNNKEAFMDKSNWALMDEITPRRWHTRRLDEAVAQFLKARDLCLRETPLEISTSAMYADASQEKTDSARIIAQR